MFTAAALFLPAVPARAAVTSAVDIERGDRWIDVKCRYVDDARPTVSYTITVNPGSKVITKPGCFARIAVKIGTPTTIRVLANFASGAPVDFGGCNACVTAKENYVALGDSFSSGEGAGNYLAGTNTSDNHCHRSANAYGPRATGATFTPALLAFHACSGARLADFTNPNASNANEPAQLDWITTTTPARLITATIGGNDAHFGDVMSYCARRTGSQPTCQAQWDAQVSAAITALDGPVTDAHSLRALYRAIRQHADDANGPQHTDVVVLTYPRLFPVNPTTACGTGVPGSSFALSDQKWMNQKAADLAGVITRAAADTGRIQVANALAAMKGHELCTTSPWFNSVRFNDTSESFHPTVDGQAALAKVLLKQRKTSPPFSGDASI